MTSRAPLIALALTLFFLSACDQAEDTCMPMLKVDEQGLPLGASCTANDQCQYNFCYLGSSHTANDETLGFCSRTCSCGEDCADEGYFLDDQDRPTTEALFLCQRPSASGGSTDTVKAFCAPQCLTLDDCKTYDDMYTTCKMPSTGVPKKLCFAE